MDNKQVVVKPNDNGVAGGTVQFPNGGPTASVNVIGPTTRPMYDLTVKQPINQNVNFNANVTNWPTPPSAPCANPYGEARASVSVSFKFD